MNALKDGLANLYREGLDHEKQRWEREARLRNRLVWQSITPTSENDHTLFHAEVPGDVLTLVVRIDKKISGLLGATLIVAGVVGSKTRYVREDNQPKYFHLKDGPKAREAAQELLFQILREMGR